MGLYCIIQRENHPDRGIDEVYGPYPDRETAHTAAEAMESDPSNINYHGSKRSNFMPWPLEAPPE